MKKVLLATALFIGSMIYTSSDAQGRFSNYNNMGNQPNWGPMGYNYAAFYYLPDLDMYYDVQARQFVYCVRGQWVYSRALPAAFRNYDLYSGYKVVINDQRPFLHPDYYRNRYRGYRNYRNHQVIIINSRDPRYGQCNNHRNDYIVVVKR